MADIKQILALSRLLEFASIVKFGIKGKDISFDDEIGSISKEIDERLRKAKGISIFSKSITLKQISEYEHYIGNSISNFTNRQLIKRDISDEVELLLKSKRLSIEHMESFNISVSKSLESNTIKIPDLNDETLVAICSKPISLSQLANGELDVQYFASSIVLLKEVEYVIVVALRHETQKKDELNINSFIIFPKTEYIKYLNNPTQLFLKGLDKYGIDMKIGNEIARYYFHTTVPITTSVQDVEFLNLQNIGPKDAFTVGMSFKNTGTSIELSNVYAINMSKFNAEMEKYFA